MLRDRRKAEVIADALGYFWLPCPLCGELFAGFEWCVKGEEGERDRPAGTIPVVKRDPRVIISGSGVCGAPACLYEAWQSWFFLPIAETA